MRSLTILEIEHIAYTLASELMSWDEPIPAFGTRYPNVLESCLIAPFQTFRKKHLYKGLVGKAGILFYLMIKNHPFQNGNKRIAVITLLYFLYKNKRWLRVDNKELYNFAIWIAESNPRVKDAAVLATHKFLKSYMMFYET